MMVIPQPPLSMVVIPPWPRPAAPPQRRGGRAVGGAPRADAGGHQLLRALRGWQGRRRQGGDGLKNLGKPAEKLWKTRILW